jgi:hypothetical protein
MQLDAEKWLSHHVNRMYDQGKLPEIARAQEALTAQAQAAEDHGIQTAPMKNVNAYLEKQYGQKQAQNILEPLPAQSLPWPERRETSEAEDVDRFIRTAPIADVQNFLRKVK